MSPAATEGKQKTSKTKAETRNTFTSQSSVRPNTN